MTGFFDLRKSSSASRTSLSAANPAPYSCGVNDPYRKMPPMRLSSAASWIAPSSARRDTVSASSRPSRCASALELSKETGVSVRFTDRSTTRKEPFSILGSCLEASLTRPAAIPMPSTTRRIENNARASRLANRVWKKLFIWKETCAGAARRPSMIGVTRKKLKFSTEPARGRLTTADDSGGLTG